MQPPLVTIHHVASKNLSLALGTTLGGGEVRAPCISLEDNGWRQVTRMGLTDSSVPRQAGQSPEVRRTGAPPPLRGSREIPPHLFTPARGMHFSAEQQTPSSHKAAARPGLEHQSSGAQDVTPASGAGLPPTGLHPDAPRGPAGPWDLGGFRGDVLSK